MGIARKLSLGLILPALVLLAWHGLSLRESEVVIPRISAVWRVLCHPLAPPVSIPAPSLAFSAAITLLRVLAGFSSAALLGVPLGLLMGRLRTVHEAVSPLATMLRVVCPIAWLPVAIVLIGDLSLSEVLYGETDAWKHEVLDHIQVSMVAIIALGALFPVLLATERGAAAVRITLLESAALMGAGAWQRFWCVVLPHAMPAVVNGMRIGLGLAWMVIVAAELYPGTRSGLGYMIWVSHDAAQYDYAFAAILGIMAIGLVLNGILYALERRVSHWQAVQR